MLGRSGRQVRTTGAVRSRWSVPPVALVVMALVVMALSVGGCEPASSERSGAVSPESTSPTQEAWPTYSTATFSDQLDAALSAAGSVHYRVVLPDGRAAEGVTEVGEVRGAWRTGLDPGTGPLGYLGSGGRFCLDRAARQYLVANNGGVTVGSSSRPWSCAQKPAGPVELLQELVRRTDPVPVLARLDPATDFASLGAEEVEGVPTLHLRVGLPSGFPQRQVDLWVDRSGLPLRMAWTMEDPGGGLAVADLDGWGQSVPLPSATKSADDLRIEVGRFGGPLPPAVP